MFKRATWLGVGFTLGVGTTVVAARKARRQLDRYKPPALVDRVTTTITTRSTAFKDHVVVALHDGKAAARAREQQLRADRLDTRTNNKLTIAPDPSSSPEPVSPRAALEGTNEPGPNT